VNPSQLSPDDHDSLAPAPSVIDAPAAATAPRFVMTVGRAPSSPGGASSVDGGSSTPGAGQPVAEATADVPAKLLSGEPPAYTREAEAAGVEADVPLEIVVDALGAVVVARVLAHVGYGLDEAALNGIRAYRFTPAQLRGKPTPVRMRWLMRFQLK
jgi:TonB family protein